MPISPERYRESSALDLLSAAARGHLAVDRRLLTALLENPDRTLPDLIRFAAGDRAKDRVDISPDLLHLFARMPSPEAVPFLIGEMRRFPDDAPMALLELAVRLGEPVTGP